MRRPVFFLILFLSHHHHYQDSLPSGQVAAAYEWQASRTVKHEKHAGRQSG